MFTDSDIAYLKKSSYDIVQVNHHDVTIHSQTTDHEWIVVSNYENRDCYILHRHSRRDPYHRQKGTYRSLSEALEYISEHEEWFINNKM